MSREKGADPGVGNGYCRDMALQFFADASPFLEVAGEHLAADPLTATVVLSLAERAAAGQPMNGPAADHDPWWLVVRDDGPAGTVVGAGMRTMGFPPYLLPMPRGAATRLAGELLDRDEAPPGANGAIGPATELCRAVAAATGGSVRTVMATRLHRLGELVPPSSVPGTGRAATAEDVELLVTWRRNFAFEVHGGVGVESAEMAREVVAQTMASGTLWVWQDDAGQAVCMVGARPPVRGVARVGPVYTPADQRRRGYAAACTALASAALRAAGAQEVCLYTDLANPTSNGVYRRIGYQPLGETVSLQIVPAPGRGVARVGRRRGRSAQS